MEQEEREEDYSQEQKQPVQRHWGGAGHSGSGKRDRAREGRRRCGEVTELRSLLARGHAGKRSRIQIRPFSHVVP